MARPSPKLKLIWKRTFRPSVEQCEGEIVNDWFSLCSRTNEGMQSAGPERQRQVEIWVFTQKLHDYGIFRARALKREAVRP